MSRIWVDKGYLIQPTVMTYGGRDFEVNLETQVFEPDGTPASGSYRGEGFLDGRRLVLGDASKPHSFLTEYLLDTRPTSESLHFLEGFKRGLADRKQVASFQLPKGERARPYVANTLRWWDGYAAAWDEKRRLQRGERGMYLLAEPGRASGRARAPRRRR